MARWLLNGSDLGYELNRHWQVRLLVGQPGYLAYFRVFLVVLAMLCIAGFQAAAVLGLLLMAARAGRGQQHGARITLLRDLTAFDVLQAAPEGQFILGLDHAADHALSDRSQPAAVRQLHAWWQGPFWLTLSLRDPYFPHSPADIVTIWSFRQAPDAWRRFRVLVQSVQWTDPESAHGGVTA